MWASIVYRWCGVQIHLLCTVVSLGVQRWDYQVFQRTYGSSSSNTNVLVTYYNIISKVVIIENGFIFLENENLNAGGFLWLGEAEIWNFWHAWPHLQGINLLFTHAVIEDHFDVGDGMNIKKSHKGLMKILELLKNYI